MAHAVGDKRAFPGPRVKAVKRATPAMLGDVAITAARGPSTKNHGEIVVLLETSDETHYDVRVVTVTSETTFATFMAVQRDKTTGFSAVYLAAVQNFRLPFDSAHWILDGRRLPTGLPSTVKLQELGVGFGSMFIYDQLGTDQGYDDLLLTIVCGEQSVTTHCAPYRQFFRKSWRWNYYFGPHEGVPELLFGEERLFDRHDLVLPERGVVSGSVLRLVYRDEAAEK